MNFQKKKKILMHINSLVLVTLAELRTLVTGSYITVDHLFFQFNVIPMLSSQSHPWEPGSSKTPKNIQYIHHAVITRCVTVCKDEHTTTHSFISLFLLLIPVPSAVQSQTPAQ